MTGEPMPLQKLSLEQNSDAPFDYTKLGHDLSTEISYLLVWEIMGISIQKMMDMNLDEFYGDLLSFFRHRKGW